MGGRGKYKQEVTPVKDKGGKKKPEPKEASGGDSITASDTATMMIRDRLNTAIGKMPAYKGTVYRGLDVKDADAFLSRIKGTGTFR